MLLTVVTVCYNSEKTIRRCIESVISQDCTDFEYLIIDGDSNDKTVALVELYKEAFARKGVRFRITSEKDTGIYNAMNKAIDLSEGVWVLFLNSDDRFYNETSLSLILKRCINTSAGIVYGDVEVDTGSQKYIQRPRELEKLRSGTEMPFCHQSTLTKLDLLKKYRFDEKYRIISDIDMYLRMYENGEQFDYYPVCVATFSNDGISQTNRKKSIQEGKTLLKNHKCYSVSKRIELNLYLFYYRYKYIIPKFIIVGIKRVKKR